MLDLSAGNRASAGRVGFQYEMGALESLAAGADVGPGRSVNIMLDSTAEVRALLIFALWLNAAVHGHLPREHAMHGVHKLQSLPCHVKEVVIFCEICIAVAGLPSLALACRCDQRAVAGCPPHGGAAVGAARVGRRRAPRPRADGAVAGAQAPPAAHYAGATWIALI